MKKSAVETLAKKLSKTSYMLAEEGKFSSEVDDLLDTYEYSGMDAELPENTKLSSDFIKNAEDVLDRHEKGTLSIRPYKTVKSQKEIIGFRGKKNSKGKTRRPFSKKSGEALQSFYGVKSNVGKNAETMLTDIYRKKKSSKSKSGRKVVKKSKGCGCK